MSLMHSPPPAESQSQIPGNTQRQPQGFENPRGSTAPSIPNDGLASGITNSPMSQRAQQVEQSCPLCSEVMNEKIDCLMISRCTHAFHRACIENVLLSTSECPVCHEACDLAELQKISFQKKIAKPKGKPRGAMSKQYHTRSFSRNLFQDPQAPLLDYSLPDAQGNPNSFNPNTPTIRSQEQASANIGIQPQIDYSLINKMIENNLHTILGNLNLATNISGGNISQDNIHPPLSRQNSNLPNNQSTRNFSHPTHFNSNQSSLSYNSVNYTSDKITSIIQNWGIKFDGSPNTIHVEEFLYRLRTLTQDNFNGDFSIICKNLHILLCGKAGAWLWRYRKQVDAIEWNGFCDAIRFQYKDYKSAFDIREEVRNRKQRPGESFDNFYEAVSSIIDRLPSPMSDTEIIEILTRNLRPEIRHELLYVPINSIPHLRKLVQMRESFLNDDFVKRNFTFRAMPSNLNRKQVAEVETSDNSLIGESSDCLQSSIDAIQRTENKMRFWNCDGVGHHWEDCLEDRCIFCYGCGEKNTYKPQCQKCQLRNSKNFKHPIPPKETI